jgi:small-conductance mechanosensitive channel
MPANDLLNELWFGNSVHDWIFAAGGAFLAAAAIVLLRTLVVRRLAKLAERTETIADDIVVELARSIRKTYVAIISLSVGGLWLDFPADVHGVLKKIGIVFAVLQGARAGNRLIAFWLEQYSTRRSGVDRTTLAALSIGAKTIVWFLLLLVALENLGVNIGALVAGLGVGGIAIALAVQNILGDLFAALSIVVDKPFIVGDTIVVDQVEGTVAHVGLKTTRVKSLNGEEVIISNADLLRSRIRNLTRREGRRMVFITTLAPGTPAAKLALVPQLVADAVASEPRATLQRSHLVGTGPLGFDVETAILIPHPDYTYAFDVRQAILLSLFASLERHDIVLARPAAAAQAPTSGG